MSDTELVVFTRGRIPGGAKNEIVHTIRDCYQRFGSRSPYKVGIMIAETEIIKKDFVREEKAKMGVTTIADDDAVCSYNPGIGDRCSTSATAFGLDQTL